MFLIHISLILFYITHIYSKKYPCIGNDKCYAETIICDKEQDCYVECSGSQACRDTTIICPPGFACNILCHTSPLTDLTTNELTCYKMTVNATQSTILNFTANFGETGEALPYPRTFEDGIIYCPNNGRSGGIKPCNIYCNGDDLMRRPNIYAVEGFNDVHIISTHYDKDWCIRGGVMRCLEDFSGDCKITNEAINGTFQCQDYLHQIEDTTCMDYIITTNIPTPNPTPIPTINSISPTESTSIDGEPGKDGGTPSGLSTTQLILAILLPLLAVACVCMGFGIYVIKKKSDSKGQHTSLQNEHAEDDEESYDDNDEQPPSYNETKPQNSNGSYENDSDDSKSDSNTSTIVDVGRDEKKGDDAIYRHGNDNDNNNNNNNINGDNNNNINGDNNVQNGHNGRHKNTISGQSDTYSDDEY